MADLSRGNLRLMTDKRIVLAGYFGYQNAGDEAILIETLHSIRTIDEKIDISVVGSDADYLEAAYGVTGILWKDSDAIVEAILAADRCILGGGGLIQDYWGFDLDELMTPSHEGLSAYLSIPLLSHLLGKPCMLHAVGVGPLQTATARRFSAEIISLCDVISVRDKYSHRLLSDIFTETNLQKNIEITADPAFDVKVGSGKLELEELEGIDFSDENILGVNLRHWDRSRAQYDWEKDVAKALDRYLLEEDGQCIFLPFQIWNHDHQTNDLLVLERVRDQMEWRDQVMLIGRVLPPKTLCSLISKCSRFVGMRYHSILFALKEKIPVLGLAYDPKVTELLNSAGMQLSIIEPDKWDDKSILTGLNDLSGRIAPTDVRPEFYEAVNKGIKKNSHLLERFIKSQDQGNSRIDQRVLGIIIAKQKRIPNLLEQISAKENDIAESLSVNKDLRVKLQEFNDEISEREKKIHQVKGQLESTRNLLSELQGRNEELASSKGWKVLTAVWRPIWTLRSYYSRYVDWIKRHIIISKSSSLTKFIGTRAWANFIIATSRSPDFSDRQVVLFVDPSSYYLLDYQPRLLLPQKIEGSRRVTLVVVGKDEESSVERWFASLNKQERLPDELICIDNGSSDRTLEQMKILTDDYKYKFQIIEKMEGTLAFCRNFGVEQASNEIIAMTDLGCELRDDWLKNIVAPFEIDRSIDVSAGLYQGRGERYLLREMIPNIDDIDPQKFLPATRSIAFTKKIWKKINGFPEWLSYSGEDTYFDLELIRANAKWALVPDAQVVWDAPTSLKGVLKKLSSWASGDGESGTFYKKYLEIYLAGIRYISIFALGLVLTLLAILSPFKLLKFIPLLYWLGFSVLLIISILKLKNNYIAVKPYLFGHIARLMGFLSGLRRRPGVISQQFQDTIGVIIIMSGVPIDDTGGGSRSAQMAIEFLRLGYFVVYLYKFPKNESIDLALDPFHPNLFEFSIREFDWGGFSFLFGPLMKKKQVRAIIQLPVREYLRLAKKIKQDSCVVVYDLIDNWDSSLGRGWYLRKVEEEILNIADLVCVSAKELRGSIEQVSSQEIIDLPNAVNPTIFDRAKVYPRPPELEKCELIITYVGALWGDWFDWDLLWRVCEEYSSASVLVIGDYKGQSIDLPPNLKLLGLKPQTMLPNYLAYSNVAIIPWKMDRITKYTSPLKIYEYIAMGLNVVAPPLETIKGLPGVYCAEDHDEFIQLINAVKDIPFDQQVLEDFILENSWESRISKLDSHIILH